MNSLYRCGLLYIQYGHNIRPVHSAAVLQRGGCDAHLRIVLPGRQCAIERDVGNHLPQLDLLGGVKYLVGVGQHQFKGEIAGVAFRVQQRDLRALFVGGQADGRVARYLDAHRLSE